MSEHIETKGASQAWREQEYAKSGARAASPYTDNDRCADIPLATFRERMESWIDNSPTDGERQARIAYREAFESALKVE